MIYLLWPQNTKQMLLDLNDSKNFRAFFKHFKTFVNKKNLLISETFFRIITKNLKVKFIRSLKIRYVFSNNAKFSTQNAITITNLDAFINQLSKFVEEDLYIFGDLMTISNFFNKVDYVVTLIYDNLKAKTIKKIDCCDFGNYTLLTTREVTKN